MKDNLVRFLIMLGLLALCLGQPVTSALADGPLPYPPPDPPKVR